MLNHIWPNSVSLCGKLNVTRVFRGSLFLWSPKRAAVQSRCFNAINLVDSKVTRSQKDPLFWFHLPVGTKNGNKKLLPLQIDYTNKFKRGVIFHCRFCHWLEDEIEIGGLFEILLPLLFSINTLMILFINNFRGHIFWLLSKIVL